MENGHGVQIRHTTCDICSPQHHCGMNAYVKDGRLVKVEGWDEHPYSCGSICTKGAAYKDYIYREDRLFQPLKRVGPRGSGEFVPISWKEAIDLVAQRLNAVKRTSGADTVAFMNGYGKWQKSYLTRLAYSFGSPNLIGDGCTCQTATHLAWDVTAGTLSWPDIAHTDVLLGWAMNHYYSNSPNIPMLLRRKAEGMKIVVIDTRVTPTARNLADIFLQIKPGTDGALAMGMANLILEKGWEDKAYIRDHVHGFEEYAAYVKQFDLKRVAEITGAPEELIYQATELYATAKRACINETAGALTQKYNGFQTYRAILALNALTGNYDREGGCLPIFYTYNHRYGGYTSHESEFMNSRFPAQARKVGCDRFPLWKTFFEAQANELPAYIRGQKDFPIRAIFGMGMNYRMFPQPAQLRQAIIEDLDFFAVADLFLTDTAKLADVVLPVCSSLEREEFRCYQNGYGYYTAPAVDRVGQSLSDLEVLERLAPKLDMEDDLLQNHPYQDWENYIIQDTGWTVQELQKQGRPVRMKNFAPYRPGTYTAKGYSTPTGKFEIASCLVAEYTSTLGYSAIPTYDPPDPDARPDYPLCLVSGVRFPTSLNSRLHNVKALRDFVPHPLVELHPDTAQALGIEDGTPVVIENELGRIVMTAKCTAKVRPGDVYAFHGYAEADVNDLFSSERLDPYTGFPAFRLTHCRVYPEKEGEVSDGKRGKI